MMIDQAKAWDTDTLATLGTLAMLGPSLCIFGFVLFDVELLLQEIQLSKDTDAGPNSNHGLKIDQAKAWDTDTLATLGTEHITLLAMLGLHTVYTVWWGYVWCGPRLLFVSLSVGLNLLLDGSIFLGYTIHADISTSRD